MKGVKLMNKKELYKQIKNEIIEKYKKQKENNINPEQIRKELGMANSTFYRYFDENKENKDTNVIDLYFFIKICKYFNIDYLRYIDMI